MPGGATATTYYDVVTRYRILDHATPGLGRYSRNTMDVHRSNEILKGSTHALGAGFSAVAVGAGAVAVGVGALAAVGYAASKSFDTLNKDLTETVNLAAQLNKSFRFNDDPAKGFVTSMKTASGIYKELAAASGHAPGKMSDLLGIHAQVSDPFFAAGGQRDGMASFAKNVALFSPATGGTFSETGSGIAALLRGEVLKSNPAQKFIERQGILRSEGGEPLTLREFADIVRNDTAMGLGIVVRGISGFADNPEYQRVVLGSVGKQIDRMSQSVFGPSGIGPQVFANAYDGFVDVLMEFNDSIETYTPGIVSGLNQVGSGLSDFFSILGHLPLGFLKDFISYEFKAFAHAGADAAKLQRRYLASEAFRKSDLFEPGISTGREGRERARRNQEASDRFFEQRERGWLFDNVYRPKYHGQSDEIMSMMRAGFMGQPTPKFDKKPEAIQKAFTDPAKINQVFNIKLDLTSDESPEAVAVKISKAIESVGKNPTTTGRATSLIPGPSAVAP